MTPIWIQQIKILPKVLVIKKNNILMICIHLSVMVPLNHFAPANLERTVEIEVFSCAALDMHSNMY